MSMYHAKKLIYILITTLLAFSCKRGIELKQYQDPYYNAFRNLNVVMVIATNPSVPNMADTIFFEEKGKKITLSSHVTFERLSFDSLNFIRSQYEGGDLYEEYQIDYRFDRSGNMVQEWNKVNNSKPGEHPVKSVIFKISNGLVATEIDSSGNRFVENLYDDKELLIKKTTFSLHPKRLLSELLFSYNDRTQLETIELRGESRTFSHYYNAGLLDSSLYITGLDTAHVKYRFIHAH